MGEGVCQQTLELEELYEKFYLNIIASVFQKSQRTNTLSNFLKKFSSP